MIDLLKGKSGSKFCAMCSKEVSIKKSHVILEIKTIPPALFFFHLDHYNEFLEFLSNYVNSRSNSIIEEFLKLNFDEVKEEKRIAKELGIESEFKKDMKETITFMLYNKLAKTVERDFICPSFEDKRKLEDCFECIDYRLFKQCTKKFIFSIRPEIDRYKKILGEV